MSAHTVSRAQQPSLQFSVEVTIHYTKQDHAQILLRVTSITLVCSFVMTATTQLYNVRLLILMHGIQIPKGISY